MRLRLLAIALVCVVNTAGCQMYRAPGSLLPSLTAARQDRLIEQHAAASSFPSPADVGLSGDSGDE